MNENNHRILELFKKYLSNTASISEEQEFFEYVQDPAYKEKIQKLLSSAFDLQEKSYSLSNASRKRILQHILKTDQTEVKKGKIGRLWLRIAVAASVVISLGIGLYFYEKEGEVTVSKLAKNTIIKQDSSKVYLTLANGNRISLSDAQDGQIAMQSGIKITKTEDGKLIYTVLEEAGTVSSTVQNTITTPKGEQYQVQLPDGTKIWLNSVSVLKYPAKFAKNERRVELQGEAYFEIAKQSVNGKRLPFIVKTNTQQVEVLGTHFNVSNYHSDSQTKTTLLEGSVKIAKPGSIVILKPGEQAVIEANKEISVKKVDTEEAVAWKNGYFIFEDADIQSIMTSLSRWYDVEVVYRGEITQQKFGGSFLRNSSIEDLLRNLQEYGGVNFKMEGRRVIVMP